MSGPYLVRYEVGPQILLGGQGSHHLNSNNSDQAGIGFLSGVILLETGW